MNTHSTQRPCDNFWLRLTGSATLMILGFEIGCDYYGLLWVVYIFWIYNALWALRVVDYGCLWLRRFIEFEWARDIPCMASEWNRTRVRSHDSRLFVSLLYYGSFKNMTVNWLSQHFLTTNFYAGRLELTFWHNCKAEYNFNIAYFQNFGSHTDCIPC